MANDFSGTAVVDRPIDEVFAFLAAGTNDPSFSPRVQEIRKATEGKVLTPLALRAARKDAPAFGQRIKAAVESS